MKFHSVCSLGGPAALRRRISAVPALALALLLTGSVAPAHAQIEGLSYSLTPTVEWIRWDSELGLEDASLYGARLGMRFGRTMTLEGFYLQNDEIASELDGSLFPGMTNPPFRNQDIALKRYGADLVLNLSHGRWVPFLTVGGSIQQFDPTLGPSFDEIGLQYGGGFRYALTPRMQARLAVQNARMRTDRFQLAPLPGDESPDELPLDPARDDFRNHLALAVGVDVQLGGYDTRAETEVDRALRARYQAGIRGAAWPIEPFVGTIRYDGSFGLADQNLLGVRSGIDFGTYLGLRAFYARGMEDGFDDTDPFQTYGAELQFLLSPGPGVRPYLIGGVGYLDYLDSFRASDGGRVDDETALLAGGGLRFDLGQHFHVDLSARDYITSSREDFESVRGKDDLTDNWMYSAGLTFQVGGGAGTPGIGRGDDVPAPVVPVSGAGKTAEPTSMATATTGTAAPATDPAQTSAQTPTGTATGTATEMTASVTRGATKTDSTRIETKLPPAVAGQKAQGDSMVVTQEKVRTITTTGTSEGMDHLSGRTVLLPVPKEGEIYVRYGTPGGVSIESWFDGSSEGAKPAASESGWEMKLRQLIRDELDARDGTKPSGNEAAKTPSDAAPARSETSVSETSVPGSSTSAAGDSGATPQALDAEALRQALGELEERLAKRVDERVDERVGATAGAAATPSNATPSKEAKTSANSTSNRSDDDAPSGDTSSDDASVGTLIDADGVEIPIVVQRSDDSGGRSLRGLAPYSALSVDEPTQFSLGLRADLGPVFGGTPLDLLPELSVSLADETTWLLGLHARWFVLGRETTRAWRPYAYAGPALLGFDESVSGFDRTNLVLDIGYGVEHDFGRFRAFAEHQGVDVFGYNRILVGLSGFRR